MILHHRAVGSYLSNCGWGSVLEGLIGGVLLLAWPMQCDHFLNTNMLVDDLDVAIRICEGLSTVPNTDVVAQILTESVNDERIAFMKLRKKALNAIEEASGGCPTDVKVIIESDSKAAVSWVNGVGGVGNVRFLDSILEIKEILFRLKPKLVFQFIPRSGNAATDFLVKMGAMSGLVQEVWAC
ncbi:hypothetical protein EZV62_001286 [Acer yangbiense]|uniref:Uncharacterized protein n=1 Tax=Acer yangbiense TaxID=1000413 RepID=A0A5C7ITQ2_9ROSI|nr:hypothetical protein EZV62_001286 [Acer yangbiense]